MAYTLIINPGSSSRKYALAENDSIIYTAQASYTESAHVVITSESAGDTKQVSTEVLEESLPRVLEDILSRGLVGDLEHIERTLFRVVAPGEAFASHRVIDSEYIAELESHTALAPLHIPPLLTEIEAVQDFFPSARLYAISDSAFHGSIPAHRRLLSVDAHDAQQHEIKRYGYHGISASSIVRTLAESDALSDRTAIIHFGGGISVHALEEGVSVDTSMGFDPSSGITMSSRGGDISAGAVLALASRRESSVHDIQHYLYTQCGFQGIVGESDMRRVLEQYEAGDTQAQLLITKLREEIQAYLAAYALKMQGLDELVLTGTALYRNPVLREVLFGDLEWWNLKLDASRNHALSSQAGIISTDDSDILVRVMPANEASEMLSLYRDKFSRE